ncbi:unnamed protein product [Pieris macdunnoughi]|uniref:DDE Tnp4 domain-containing protein n=2 Tax=Pieris macdunnoughi TaxID=345717 RepID=A0A821VWA9_9NEOP|nr:unnamed protein product [Pieris macdunnoughi]
MALQLISSSDSDSDSDLEGVGYSESDDSNNNGPRPRPRRIKRINFMHNLNDTDFTFRFRLNKPAVELLLTEIMPFVRVTSMRNNGVPPLHQLLLTLRFYALGTMLISVADFIGVSKSSAGRIVRDISVAIARLYDKYVVMHQQIGADKFYSIAQFPRVLGAIDCTHIRIQSPCLTIGEEFRNRKNYFSLNVQAVCDADLRLMNVVARWPGSTHDATIFNNSVLRAQCDSGAFGNRWLLGDSAYPNRNYLLTPILSPVSDHEQRYNYAQIKTRNTIERTFGVWKRRFPVIALTLRLSLRTVQAVIIATAVLHNICRSYNLAEVSPEVELPPTDIADINEGPQNAGLHDIRQRTDLVNNYFRN